MQNMGKVKKNFIVFFLDLVIAIFIVVLCFPIFFIFLNSFFSSTDLTFYYFGGETIEYLKLFPDNFTISQYGSALYYNTIYTRAFLNSLLHSISSLAIGGLLALPVSYVFAISKSRWKKPILIFMLIIMLIPYHALIVPQYLFWSDWGILGNEICIILSSVFETMEVLLLCMLFSTISPEIIEAASVDGASLIEKMRFVVLPQLKRGIFVVCVLKFCNAFSEVEKPLVFLNDISKYPLSLFLPIVSEQFPESSFGFSVIYMCLPFLFFCCCPHEILMEEIFYAKESPNK